MKGRLAGHAAILALGHSASDALASRLAGEGASVVLVTPDAERGGRTAASIQAGTARHPAVYCTEGDLDDDDLDALVELVEDLTR